MTCLVLLGDLMEKLKTLKKSLEEGVISKEEYEKEKKKIEKEEDNQEQKKKENKHKKQTEEVAKKSDKILIIVIVLVLLSIAIFFLIINNKSNIRPKTIDELHQTNVENGLPEEQGYMYNGFSFVKVAGLWHTEILSDSGRILYEVSFHFSPRELEDVKLVGTLNNLLFNSEDEIYITFNPLGKSLQYTALAVGEFDQSMIKSFAKIPVAACIKNETIACKTRPIITCENTNMPVAYFKEDEKTLVTYDDNCIIIQGNGLEMVRATDRMLMQFYGIMK